MSEFVGISQPFSHTGNQKDPSLTTLEAIARSSMRPSFLSVLMGRTLGFLIQVLTGSSENFVSYFPCVGNENIRIAGGSLAPILGKWKKFSFEGPPLHNVLHVPKISYNLLSISKITHELNCRATFLLDFVSFLAQGGCLALYSTIGNSNCLMMMPPLLAFLELVFYLHTLLFLKEIVNCGIFV